MNKTAFLQDATRIKRLANTPDDAIMLFKDTPIFDTLLKRREFSRIISINLINRENIKVIRMYDEEIKKALLL